MTHVQLNIYHSIEKRLQTLESTFAQALTFNIHVYCMNAFTQLLAELAEEDIDTQANIPEHLLSRLHVFAYKLTAVKKQYELAYQCQNN